MIPDLEEILFIDIETVPETQNFDQLSVNSQNLFEEKTRYARKNDCSAEEFYERAGIWAEFGKIICISLGYFVSLKGERQFRTTSFYGEEYDILIKFSNLITSKFKNNHTIICGHNIKEFDLPYICRRMIINNIKIPILINNIGKKPWEIKHLDTLELWKFGDYKHYTSLKLLCSVLNIPSPKEDIDGSQVSNVYYQENNMNKIISYCEKDVLAVAQIILKLKQLPLIESHEHKSV